MKFEAFLIKYGEIGIKGKNRYIFENALIDQIKYSLRNHGRFHVVREQGRIVVKALSDYEYDDVTEALQSVFGIVSICPVLVKENNDWDNLTKAVGEYIESVYEDKNFSFKVAAKRSDKSYKMTSPEIVIEMGAYILEQFPTLSVDIHNPQVYITVELRTKVYIYSKVIKGAGGLPVGTNGKAMVLLSGGIDSPVAGYMIAKRGVVLEAVYFHAPPYTSERAKQKVADLAKLVSKYSGPINLHVINFTDIQLYIYEKCPHEELTIIMRRYMMKIAERIAGENGCEALVTGESIGQVASQTMQGLAATNEVCTKPVFRPLIGFDKQEIIDIANKINTFETSILPYEDCCTIFVAKHPVTKPNIKKIKLSEKNLSEKIDELVEKAFETKELIRIE